MIYDLQFFIFIRNRSNSKKKIYWGSSVLDLLNWSGIGGSSYMVQLGRVNNNLVSLICRDKNNIAFNKFKHVKITDNFDINEILF